MHTAILQTHMPNPLIALDAGDTWQWLCRSLTVRKNMHITQLTKCVCIWRIRLPSDANYLIKLGIT